MKKGSLAFIAFDIMQESAMKYSSLTKGKLGATVAGIDPCSTGGHPQLQQKEKETPNEQVSVHY